MDDKEYFDLKFNNLEKNQKDNNERICISLEKINNKITKLFEKSDKHHDQLILQERDISDLKDANEKMEKANEKKKDRGWKFFIDIASKVAVAIFLFILGYLQFKGG